MSTEVANRREPTDIRLMRSCLQHWPFPRGKGILLRVFEHVGPVQRRHLRVRVALGDGNAVDLLTGLGARRPRVAVLVSGYGSPEDLARSREAGFDAYFVKQPEFNQPERTLRTALATARPRQRASRIWDRTAASSLPEAPPSVIGDKS